MCILTPHSFLIFKPTLTASVTFFIIACVVLDPRAEILHKK